MGFIHTRVANEYLHGSIFFALSIFGYFKLFHYMYNKENPSAPTPIKPISGVEQTF
jgi:hypothetical protein